MGMTIAELLRDPSVTLEIVGFSEEEGVRFSKPFIGSTAFVEGLNEDFLSLKDENGIAVAQAIESFGIAATTKPQMNEADAYLEFHIEQGPVLESLNFPLAVVDAIVGQTRATIEFIGKANHAGTTPMYLRHDAFAAAAEWTLYAEQLAQETSGLVATIGSVKITPGAINIIPGHATLSLDIRHANDVIRDSAFAQLMGAGYKIAKKRKVEFKSTLKSKQLSVPMDPALVQLAAEAIGGDAHRMTSGAGHDAMIISKKIPSVMIFLRSPGGLSHHPDESVLVEDVEAALKAGLNFVEYFAR